MIKYEPSAAQAKLISTPSSVISKAAFSTPFILNFTFYAMLNSLVSLHLEPFTIENLNSFDCGSKKENFNRL